MLSCIRLPRLAQGKPDQEPRLAGTRFHTNITLVLADDAVYGIQAQAGALARRFGREERFKNPAPDLGRDAGSVVDDLDSRAIALTARSNAKLALAIHRVHGVINKIRPDLVQFTAIGAQKRESLVEIAHHGDALFQAKF